MPESISKDQAVHTLLRLGHQIVAEKGSVIMFLDPKYPGPELKLDFSREVIPWDDFKYLLEYEGINVQTFLAELESMG